MRSNFVSTDSPLLGAVDVSLPRSTTRRLLSAGSAEMKTKMKRKRGLEKTIVSFHENLFWLQRKPRYGNLLFLSVSERRATG